MLTSTFPDLRHEGDPIAPTPLLELYKEHISSWQKDIPDIVRGHPWNVADWYWDHQYYAILHNNSDSPDLNRKWGMVIACTANKWTKKVDTKNCKYVQFGRRSEAARHRPWFGKKYGANVKGGTLHDLKTHAKKKLLERTLYSDSRKSVTSGQFYMVNGSMSAQNHLDISQKTINNRNTAHRNATGITDGLFIY